MILTCCANLYRLTFLTTSVHLNNLSLKAASDNSSRSNNHNSRSKAKAPTLVR